MVLVGYSVEGGEMGGLGKRKGSPSWQNPTGKTIKSENKNPRTCWCGDSLVQP